ncbi:MAG: CPBP family intramembrane metalloprotease [Opitutaceae bacterium]|nr:CPBP family intramembrane metalloprotease [Opitutaceae bacterium]
MPDSTAQAAIAIELALFFAGCILLWRLGLSPTARGATRSQPSPLPAWEIPLSSFFLFLWLVVCGGLIAQMAAVPLLQLVPMGATARLILTGAAFHGGMFLGVALFMLRYDRPWVARLAQPLRRLLPAGLATFLIVLPVLTAVSLAWQGLLEFAGIPVEPQDLIDIFANAKSPRLLTLMIILATVVAPITEELVFRAGLFRFARTRLPRWAALFLPACLFAALHANLASFAPLAVLGVIFSLAYERTGSIAVPIIAHGLFNLNTILLLRAGLDGL